MVTSAHSAESPRKGNQVELVEAVERVDVGKLAHSMRETGFGLVENFVPPSSLQALQSHARETVRRHGDESLFQAGEALEGSLIGELARSKQMTALLAELYAAVVGSPPSPEETIHPALRCLFGPSSAAASLQFHFDSHIVTALLPVHIPTSGDRGDFLYYPNVRRVRRSAAVNVLEKIVCQNPLGVRIIASRRFRSVLPPQRLELVPGNLYTFWGYRTLHGNDRCDGSQLRATALFHFGDPHLNDPMVQFIHRRARRRGR